MTALAGTVLWVLSLLCGLAALAFARNYGQPVRKLLEWYLRSAVGSRVSRRLGTPGELDRRPCCPASV
jgi:hypothetical protein